MEFILSAPNNSTFIHIFNYPIKYYGIILSIALFCGLFLSEYLVKIKHDEKTLQTFQDSTLLMVILGIIGARVFYVLGSLDYYLNNPKEILMLNHGGISIYGTIIFGIITLIIYSKIKKISFLKYADFYALVLPLCQSIGRFGNFFNQEAYGKPTNGFIKLFIDENHRLSQFSDIQYYHPTFLYESILDFVVFAILISIYLKSKKQKTGLIFALYLILYSLVRIFIENIRIDSVMNLNNIPIAIIISILVFIIGVFVLFLINKKCPKN